MKCRETRPLLNAHLDGELSWDTLSEVNEHLKACAECKSALNELDQLQQGIISAGVNESAPLHLRSSISAGLQAIDKVDSYHAGLPAALSWGLPALVLGLLLGWVGLSYLNDRDSHDSLLMSLASAHVDSLMADHLTDIASSDSHAVKPWFHGRLDFSPPVYDFTQQGFPLLGGRLDYIADGPAAALVYRHRQHTINLFVRPMLASAQEAQFDSFNGYHFIHWQDASLSYWAVSDLNRSDLEQFRALVSAAVR